MTLIDRVLDKLDEICREEHTQRRLQMTLLDPAAAYLARKLFKFILCFTVLQFVQIAILMVLLMFQFHPTPKT